MLIAMTEVGVYQPKSRLIVMLFVPAFDDADVAPLVIAPVLGLTQGTVPYVYAIVLPVSSCVACFALVASKSPRHFALGFCNACNAAAYPAGPTELPGECATPPLVLLPPPPGLPPKPVSGF